MLKIHHREKCMEIEWLVRNGFDEFYERFQDLKGRLSNVTFESKYQQRTVNKQIIKRKEKQTKQYIYTPT